ncbi:cytochrome c biogenesis protein CcsA [Bacillus sp. V3B]|uniref:cytochrome C assembly family protein n=1 Tax=Bacillus sp. V3B TaxID=2804915 RepID=UPI00210C99C0|nr:cytochrome c biogenesis protein CcsA [Bacillus sp. V3B]MCQ6273499.1 cytochrome c biogenesis protein CcsA [Bacillus sp. V3B]
MVDNLLTRLHELTVVLYAVSVLLYFIDFLHHNRRANRTAFWLLSFVWVLQSVSLYAYMIHIGRFPVLTIFEGLYFYVWVLITLSLVVNYLLRVDFIVFFTNVIGFMFLVIHTFAPEQFESTVKAQQLMSELLLIHITVAILSYGAFSLAFVFSLLYLLQYNLLKQKKWGKRLWRITDLSKLEHMSYILTVIGVPMLLIGVILGTQWAYLKLPNISWLDPKVIGSVFVLAVYCVYLYLRLRRGLAGKTLALWNIAAFLILLINFFLIGNISSFHIWL